MYDLIVIGGGLSGLQAAYTAKQAGLSVAVLEARNRVGGKVWTVPLASGRGFADLGAAWVNDSLQPLVWSYVQRFGLKTTTQPIDGSEDGVPFGIVPNFPEDEKQKLIKIRDHIEEKSKMKEAPRPEDDRISLDQYVRNLGSNETTAKMVNIWTRAMHGMESTEESAAYFIDYCRSNHGLLAVRADDKTGGNYMRLHGGTMEIADKIAALIGKENIHLNTPVVSIDDQTSRVIIRAKTGPQFHARKCIISIPSTMYRELTSTPPLPPPVQEMTNATRLDHYNKAIVCYDKLWWKNLLYNGFFFSYKGPIAIARDSSVPEKDLYELMCLVNGRAGEEWSKLDVFTEVYGKPIGNLHFVGTESSGHWEGYVEGALTTGDRGAKEVVAALGGRVRVNL